MGLLASLIGASKAEFDIDQKFMFATPANSDRKQLFSKTLFAGELSFDRSGKRSLHSSAMEDDDQD